MRRLPLFVALLAPLAAGCGREPEAPRSAGGDATLEAPAPSSVTLAGLLSAPGTGYDNDQQARYLQEEAKRMGISNLDKPSEPNVGREEVEEPGSSVSYEEGVARTKSMTRQFSVQRRAIERDQPKPVGLDGATPGMIPGKAQGGPLE